MMIEPSAEATLPLLGERVRILAYEFGSERVPDVAVAIIRQGDAVTASTAPPLVRIHSQCLSGDTLGSSRCDCGAQLRQSLAAIIEQGWGILIYLPSHEGRGIGLVNKIRAYALQDVGLDTAAANLALGLPVDRRRYEHAIAILRNLRVSHARLLTNNPDKVRALRSAGIVVERVAMVPFVTEENRGYLETKRVSFGHLLPAGLGVSATNSPETDEH